MEMHLAIQKKTEPGFGYRVAGSTGYCIKVMP
jgi:hypothetical protein